MVQEKRRPWHRLVLDKLYAIVTSRPRPGHVLRTIFNYPDGRAQLRPTAWLDGLRGVAAFEVMLYHYHLQMLFKELNKAYGSQPTTKQWWRLPFIKNFYSSGHAMVNVFFLISGFVLTQRSLTLIRSQQYDKLYPSISSAVFRRGIRIYLPAVAVSFVGMVMAYLDIKDVKIGEVNLPMRVVDWIYACRDFVNPFHNYYNGFDIVHRYEHTMWTLPLELYGSMVCYLTVMMVARITHPVKRTTIVVLLAWFAAIKQNWWSTNFLIGMLHADFMIWQGKTEKSWSTSIAARCCWVIVLIWALYVIGLPEAHYDKYTLPGFDWYYGHVPESWKAVEGGARYWWMISGCAMTVAISQLPLLKKILETTVCQYLGRISFMLYLVHTYVYELVGRPWRTALIELVPHADVPVEEDSERLQRVAIGNGRYVVYFSFWVVMLPLILIVAGQVTKYVDNPSIRFGKWLETKFTDDDEKDVSPIPIYARVDTEIS